MLGAPPVEQNMGARNFLGVRTVVRRGKRRLILDFRFTAADGTRTRFRRDASVQNQAAAVAEAARLMKLAAETGRVEVVPATAAPPDAEQSQVTYSEFFVRDFKKLFMPSFRESTRVRYEALHRQRIDGYFGPLVLRGIESKHFREFAATLQNDGVQTKGPLNLVRTVLRAAQEQKLIDIVPELPKGIIKSSRKLAEAPSNDEYKKMLGAPGWLGDAVALAGLAGLRMCEVRGLEVGDVDFDAVRIVVRHSLSEDVLTTPKSGHERVVEMVPELADRLREVVKGKLPRARVVVDENGRTPRRQEVLHQFKKFLKKNDLKERSFHSLRHRFISEMVRKGASIEAVRELAGHSSLAVTERYAHATGKDRRDAVSKLR